MAIIEIKAKKADKTLKIRLNDDGTVEILSPNVNLVDVLPKSTEIAIFLGIVQRAKQLLLMNGLDYISFEEVQL